MKALRFAMFLVAPLLVILFCVGFAHGETVLPSFQPITRCGLIEASDDTVLGRCLPELWDDDAIDDLLYYPPPPLATFNENMNNLVYPTLPPEASVRKA